jgi:4-carboxymuconolactone decarboxylase
VVAGGSPARRPRGLALWADLTGLTIEQPRTPLDESAIDFVGAEVWARPGLTRKERRWITLTCAAVTGRAGPLRYHLRAALRTGDITLDELREFVLHLAVYAGWPTASEASSLVTEVADELRR